MKKNEKKRGQVLAETAASMALLIALGVLILFAVCSITYAYLVRTSLAEASRYAARNLAVAYGSNPKIATSRTLQEVLVLDKIRIHNILVSSQQFTDVAFNTASGERSVRVAVTYQANQFGLPPMPLPDPLNLDLKPMTVTSTYRLE